MLTRRISSLLCAGLIGWAIPPASAQVGAGRLIGAVRDQAGHAVTAIEVTATNTETNARRVTPTNPDGSYTLPSLPPGSYRLDVRPSGFAPFARTGLRIATGETLRVDVVLAAAGATDRVVVTADAPLLRGETASLGQVVSHDKVVQLPLNGRTFIALAALTPGVALPPASLLPRINGGRPRTNEYLFDGISVLQPEPGQVAFFPVLDAIQEFKIESNSPPAEFGRFNGGVVNLTTRSGTNVARGTAFDFGRDESLNARNYFASKNPAKPAFRRQQFGGVLGGPLRADRTFFFADYQGQRQAIGRTVISTVPTLLQRRGVFTEPISGKVAVIYDPATTTAAGTSFTRSPFPDNSIPVERFDPIAAALLLRYPMPTSDGTANNYQRVDNEIDNQNQADVRIDHRTSSGRDAFFGRLSRFHDRFVPVTPLPEGSGVTTGTLGPQLTDAWSFASSYQHVFSLRLLNELRVGDTRRAVDRSASRLDGPVSASLGLPGIPSVAQFPDTLPTVVVSGYQQLGSPANTASKFSTGVTEVADTLSWLRGRHSIKVGFDLRWERLNVIQPPSPTGSFTFTTLFTDLPGTTGTGSSLASFLLGQVQTFSIDLQEQAIRNRAHIQEYFVQDDWRLTGSTTLNLGLRYTLNFPSTEVHDQAAVFNLDSQQLEYLGRDGQPRSARTLHKLNFGPRVGVAQRLGEHMVVRGGYGLVWIEQAGITTPFTTPSFPFLQTVTQRTLDNVTPAFILSTGPAVAPVARTPLAGLGQGVFAVDRALGSGYVQQWNVAWQRTFFSSLSIEVAYVGSQISHVGLPDANINQLTVDQLALGAALLQRVPNPYFGTIPRSSSLGDPTITVAQLMKPYPQYTAVSLYRNNIGTTNYQGVTLKLEQRTAHGLSYLLSYTRSRLVDDASSVFDASILTGPLLNAPVADAFNRKRDRDVSTGDIPHVFVGSVVWNLPRFLRHWSVAAIATLQSGIPLAVTQATNFNAFAGFGTQRPNLVGDPNLPADQRNVAQWFNTSAFAVAPQFTLGSASRNPLRGPSYRNLDLVIARSVSIGHGRTIEGRVEVFNATNTTPFNAPNTVVASPGFGSITSAGDPRVVQLAAKIHF